MSVLNNSRVEAVVAARDLERATKFYQETLGLDLVHEGEGGVLFEAGEGTRLLVYPRPQGEPAEQTVATWTVDDVETAVDDLTERGIEFEQYDMPNLKTDERGIATVGEMRGAWFKDSEGNILAVGTLTE